MFAVPSFIPIRLRGVVLAAAGARGAAEAELGPAHDDGAAADPGQVADRVEGDLGVVGAGLHAEVAAAFLGDELVAGQRRDLPQGGRPLAAQAEAAALEEARARSRR